MSRARLAARSSAALKNFASRVLGGSGDRVAPPERDPDFPYLSEANKITGFFMTSASKDFKTAAYDLFNKFQELRLHVVNKINEQGGGTLGARMYEAPKYSSQVARQLDPFAEKLIPVWDYILTRRAVVVDWLSLHRKPESPHTFPFSPFL